MPTPFGRATGAGPAALILSTQPLPEPARRLQAPPVPRVRRTLIRGARDHGRWARTSARAYTPASAPGKAGVRTSPPSARADRPERVPPTTRAETTASTRERHSHSARRTSPMSRPAGPQRRSRAPTPRFMCPSWRWITLNGTPSRSALVADRRELRSHGNATRCCGPCSSALGPPDRADRGDRAQVLDQHPVDGESALA